MNDSLWKQWASSRRALLGLVVIGLSLRLIAAVYSRGFLTSDDHHTLVKAADYLANDIPLADGYPRSVFYSGPVALIMMAAQGAGIGSPDSVMVIVRLIQAVFSLIAIVLVFRILERTSGRETAFLGGLLMAVFYVFPVTSVHQFEEVVSQVPLLAGLWWLTRAEEVPGGRGGLALLSGALMGVAMSVRPQLITFIAPLALLLLYRRSPRIILYWVLGLVLVVVLQGASNAIFSHEWFSTLRRYYRVLNTNRGELFPRPNAGLPTGPVWGYVLTLLWLFVFPFSLLVIAAIIRGGRVLPRLGIPALTFFIAHSLISNKQERFLLPILPVLIILAAAGFPAVRDWFARRGWSPAYRGLWTYFGVVNAVLVLLTIFHYGKKDRVAPLVAIERRHDATGIVTAQYTYEFHTPTYYLGRPTPRFIRVVQPGTLAAEMERTETPRSALNYVILYSDAIASDSAGLAAELGRPLRRIAAISPSLGDRLAHAINPQHNKAGTVVVYKCD